MDCHMEDLVMMNVAADIDEVRDVILALMPRLHTALVKRECEGCTLYHHSKTEHRCLDPVECRQRHSQDQDRPVFGQMYWWTDKNGVRNK